MFKQLPPVTKNLLIINGIVFLAQLVFGQRGTDLAALLGLHFVLAPDFAPWQLVTYMFLHADFSHLFFNMFSLWMFGRIVEQTLGMRRFLVYFFVCGVGAGICQELWQLADYYISGMDGYTTVVDPSGLTMPMADYLNLWTTIGASGACYGVLLAYGMSYPEERIMLLIPPIPIKAKYFVVGYGAIELFSAFFTNGNIAHFAHLGGMLFGLLLLLHWRRRGRGRRFGGWETWTPRRSRTLAERWRDLRDGLRRRFARRKGMGVKRGGAHFKDRDADYDYNRRSKEQQERTDRILDKIRRGGYQSLTEEEKRQLFDNSKK